ncbi:Phosphopantetheine attachment site [Pseudomonas sp. LAMO17WK12:I10]|uniref:beta-ketoacyl synthase N-terminal-like domain-containing protein n=1 Tax=unclassified Pseudomonas TaxID=196821 RepID=UPI000BD0F450|nr:MULTISPECIES: beta-ketoacyl synthase N-terminal-like domain-containing protein [unclassified Pseudomonas]PXX69497.1 phosphopantetheine binding protein [Pseudomonas sp. LAMO17WK12:I9]SNY32828.1 Phosphopantetheine attachment site [Pseudomonas sp. LAMO17WK12:I10]
MRTLLAESKISLSCANPVIGAHWVHGRPVFPGLAYIDLIYQVCQKHGLGFAEHRLQTLRIHRPLALEGVDGTLVVRVALFRDDPRYYTLLVEDLSTDGQARPYATAELEHTGAAAFAPEERLAPQAADGAREVTPEALYGQCRDHQLMHDDYMQVRGHIRTGRDGLLANLTLGPQALPDAGRFLFHPALFDGAAISSQALELRNGEQSAPPPSLYLPLLFQGFSAVAPITGQCRVRIKADSVSVQGELVVFTLEFFADSGEKIAQIERFTAKRVRAEQGLHQPPIAPPVPTRQAPPPTAPAGGSEHPLVLRLRRLIADKLGTGVSQVALDKGYYELGLDSADLLDLVTHASQALGLELSPTLLFEHTTLQELGAFFQQHYGAVPDSAPAPAAEQGTAIPQSASWTQRFVAEEAYLQDHLVLGTPALMGVTHPCLAIEACLEQWGAASFPLSLGHIRLLGGPITLQAGQSVELTVALDPQREAFSVGFRRDRAANVEPCCVGQLRLKERFEARHQSPDSLLAGLTRLSDEAIEQSYRRIPQFSVGPLLQNIREAYTDGDSLLVSKVDLGAPRAKGGRTHYGFDPLLLNGCFFFRDPDFGQPQSSMYVPLLIERIVQARPLPSTVYLVNRLRTAKAGYVAFDVDVLSLEGEHLASIVNASVRQVSDPARLSNANFSRPAAAAALAPAEDDIAIIGLAGRYPGADDLEQFWRNLSQGVDSITPIPATRWDHGLYFDADKDRPGKTYGRWGGFLEDIDQFDPFYFAITPREAGFMDPQERLFLQCAVHALEDAGYTRQGLPRDVGVYVGVMYQEYQLYGAQQTVLGNPMALGGSASSIANRVSYVCNFTGPSMAVDTMCSSSLTALYLACRALERGDCSSALVGGVNLSLHPNKYLMLGQGRFVSSEGRCQAFGEGGDGYVPGEGVGVMLIKPRARAEADGDHIYGLIKACEINHGGKSAGYSVPGVKTQADVIARAYGRAGIDPRHISYLEAHGTGTALGDPIEIAALGAAFRPYTEDRQFCAIGSVKSNIGHCESAAGIAGITKVLLQIKHRQRVPSLHSATLNPRIDFAASPFVVQQQLEDWPALHLEGKALPRLAGLSSFGAGGSNAHMVLQEYLAAEDRRQVSTPAFLIPLSAASQPQLQRLARALGTRVTALLEEEAAADGRQRRLADVTFTLQSGREVHPHRLGLLVDSLAQLSEKLQLFLAVEVLDARALARLREQQVFVGERTSAGGLPEQLAEVDVQLLVNAWIERQRLDEVLRFWSQGAAVDWHQQQRPTGDQEYRPRRISLPGYPFAQERYWFEPRALANAVAAPAAADTVILAPLAQATTAFERLAQALFEITGISPERLDPHGDFESLGLDSVMIMKLNQQVSAWTGETDATLFYKYKTLHELSEYLQARPGLAVAAPIPAETLRPVIASTPSGSADSAPAMDDDSIAIIGMSGRYPQSETLEAFWQNLRDGVDCVTEIPLERFDYRSIFTPGAKGRTDAIYCKWGGFLGDVSQFDAPFFNVSAMDAAFMDPQERLFLEMAWTCLESAGYLTPRWQATPRDFGVFAGVSVNNYQLVGADALKARAPFYPAGSQTFSVANRVSYFFNLTGPSLTVDTACSSSLYALHLACESLRNGETRAALAGGVNLALHPSKYLTLCAAGFAASDGRCRAFATGGDGYVPSEGVGVVLLKRHADALRDGDRVLALIKGSGVSHDGKTQGFTVPNPVSQTQAINAALARSGVPRDTINYIEAHGTGTTLGDPIEIQGLIDAYANGSDAPVPRALGSVKASIGHGEASAGIAQLTKTVLQLQHGTLVPSLLHGPLNSDIPFARAGFHIPDRAMPWPVVEREGRAVPRRAAISSFGAGGVNVHMILEQAPETVAPPAMADSPCVLVLSAQATSALKEQACRLLGFLDEPGNDRHALADIAFTLGHHRAALRFRLALVVADRQEARMRLRAWLEQADSAPVPGLYLADSLDRGAGAPATVAADDLDGQARAWVAGAPVQWPGSAAPGRCVPLPGYPFQTRRHWIADQLAGLDPSPLQAATAAPLVNLDHWLMQARWVEAPAGRPATAPRHVLVFGEDRVMLKAWALQPGVTTSSEVFDERRIAQLIDDSQADTLVLLQPYSALSTLFGAELDRRFAEQAGVLTQRVQALASLATTRKGLKLVLLNITHDGQTDGVQESLTKYFSFLRYEVPEIGSLVLDTDSLESPCLEQIVEQLHCRQALLRLRLQGGQWLTPALQPLAIARDPASDPALDLSGSMIVTGGFGGIGLTVLRWLVNKGLKSLIVIGRKPLSAPLRHPGLSAGTTGQVLIDSLAREQGVRLHYVQSDLSDETALARQLDGLRPLLGGPISGVFHLAGVTTEAIAIQATSASLLAEVARPKLLGAQLLERLTLGDPLRYFCLFSSISAVEGMQGNGLSAYSAANAGLVAFAAERRQRRLPAQLIQWTDWDGAGMAVAHNHRAFFDALGMRMLTPDQGVALLERILANAIDECIVFDADWERFAAINPAIQTQPVFAHYRERLGKPAAQAMATAQATAGEPLDIGALLRDELQQLLGLEDIHPEQTFAEIGLDSVNSLAFFSTLSQRLAYQVLPSAIFRYPTIRALADYIAANREQGPLNGSREPAPAATGQAPVTRPAEESAAIAIVGMSGQFPKAPDLPRFWEQLCAGFDGVGHYPRARRDLLGLNDSFSDQDLLGIHGGYLDDIELFDPGLFNISPREARFMDPQQRLLLLNAHRAIEDAGIKDHPGLARTGVFIAQYASEYMQFANDYDKDNALFIATGNAGSIAANRLSYHYGLRGPSLVLDTACSSTLVAIDIACQYLRSGQIDFALVGGVSLNLSPALTRLLQDSGMLSPSGRCQTFDAKADGYVPGEGVGMIVLQRQADARQHLAQHPDARVYALIAGSAVNQDGKSNGMTAPNGLAQEDVIRQAFQRAGLAPARAGYVETHGTGTYLGDPVEIEALGNVLNDGRGAGEGCILGCLKTNIGHLEPAAGIASVIKAALCLYLGKIPGNNHLATLNPLLAPSQPAFRLPDRPLDWDGAGRVAGVSSFGFGGVNAHVVLTSVDTPAPAPERERLFLAHYPRPRLALKAYWARRASPATVPAVATASGAFLKVEYSGQGGATREALFTLPAQTPGLLDTGNFHVGFYLEAIYQVFRECFGRSTLHVSRFDFQSPLLIAHNVTTQVRMSIEPLAAEAYRLRFDYRALAQPPGAWMQTAEALVDFASMTQTDTSVQAHLAAVLQSPGTPNRTLDETAFYARYTQMGFPADGFVRAIDECRLHERFSLSTLTAQFEPGGYAFGAHPGLIDAALQPSILLADSDENVPYMTTTMEDIYLNGPLRREEMYRLVNLLHAPTGEAVPTAAVRRFQTAWALLDSRGESLVTCARASLQQLATSNRELSAAVQSQLAEAGGLSGDGLLAIIAELLDCTPEEIDLDKALLELGMDSLMLIKLQKHLDHQQIAVSGLFKMTLRQLLEQVRPDEPHSAGSAHVASPGQPAADSAFAPFTQLVPWSRDKSRWLRGQARPGSRIRLYCFPYAHLSSTVFKEWQALLPADVEVRPIELPNRGDRLRERPLQDMWSLAATLTEVLGDELDQPFALYGHSAGALMAYVWCQHLRAVGRPMPRHLFAAAYSAPGQEVNPVIRDMLAVYRQHGLERMPSLDEICQPGTEPVIGKLIDALEFSMKQAGLFNFSRELIHAQLPSLVATFEMVDRFQPGAPAPLALPISGLHGLGDIQVPESDVRGWRRLGNAGFTFKAFEGNHLFIEPGQSVEQVTAYVGQVLQDIVDNAPGTPSGAAEIRLVPSGMAAVLHDSREAGA